MIRPPGETPYRFWRVAIFPAACLTHITRKFKEACEEHPRITARILLLIDRITRSKSAFAPSAPAPSTGSAPAGSNPGNHTITLPN